MLAALKEICGIRLGYKNARGWYVKYEAISRISKMRSYV
jgi:hypothetical protein